MGLTMAVTPKQDERQMRTAAIVLLLAIFYSPDGARLGDMAL